MYICMEQGGSQNSDDITTKVMHLNPFANVLLCLFCYQKYHTGRKKISEQIPLKTSDIFKENLPKMCIGFYTACAKK